jgi:GGDEF domain-containing protein
LGIQFVLVIIGAGLSFDVGRHLDGINSLLEGLSASTYPNRTLEIKRAEDRISAELTRSRRYHHPLSLLLVELDKKAEGDDIKVVKGLQKDLLHRFALARIGQIISDRARETDLILRDRAGRFLLLCPETNSENSLLFGDRIRRAVMESMGADVNWSFASFPEDALTFEELVEFAEHRLGILDPSQTQDQAQEQKQGQEALV